MGVYKYILRGVENLVLGAVNCHILHIEGLAAMLDGLQLRKTGNRGNAIPLYYTIKTKQSSF
jgi:hypothetical protein